MNDVIPLSVCLVGCGKAKLQTDKPVKACELYRSTLFRMSMKYGLLLSDDVHILSAKHGLLAPYAEVTPYDETLDGVDVESWANSVVNDLIEWYDGAYLDITCLAGSRYASAVFQCIMERRMHWEWNNPLQSMGLFQRLKWLKEEIGVLS